ncbi:helix-turn-helix transcriptional regulator [Christiangramia portivictoriae]|uniref:helix-turn-helix transcriptional regulator n=1 Tax=Christiangramia portivictoriae TaxID=326069 RepID=UPI0004032F0C|nr:WYL domain-containing protein [Christiangramia portivictoriae]
MSVNQTMKRYTKIISLLRRRPMSYQELQDEISLDPDAIEDNLLTSQRTLQRDLKGIASNFEIEIASDKSCNKYYIKEDTEDLQTRRLRENFEIVNAIKLSRGFADCLVFEERRHLGTEHMAGLIHAIQNRLVTEFNYTKFWDSSETQRKVKPIALKEAQNRWYLIGQDQRDSRIKNFSLDRIKELNISPIKFQPVPYNVHKEFKESFGIINGTDEKATEIILSFTPEQGRYVESLPLHHSQTLINKTKEEITFSYYIRPTFDFKMEILSYGNKVKIIEPVNFQRDIIEDLQSTLAQYDI